MLDSVIEGIEKKKEVVEAKVELSDEEDDIMIPHSGKKQDEDVESQYIQDNTK